MSSTEDKLYSRLNARGRKSFRPTERAQLAEKFPEYAKVGLPAHKAAIEGNIEALKEIYAAFSDDGVPSRDVNGATPLHLAVRGNRIEAVKWLQRFTDLSPTISAKHGESPCHVAAALGNTECLKAMLGADAKEDICVASDNEGFTALHLAIVKSRNEVAKLLISELGAKGVGSVSDTGITAAHVAASSGNVEVLKMIASKNKKLLSEETTDGTTPLYFAAQEGRLAAIRFLHEKLKCDISARSNDGRKPIHAACQCGHTHIVKYIVSQLSNHAIFDTVPDGATTLHFASSTGQLKTAKWLIDSDVGGTLVTSKDNNGDTPAHDAADNGRIETLKLLLESGADLYAVNSDGNTPYSLALNSQEPGMADFVMEFASNAPQKQEEGPSRMTIFDMQGEVDVVDLPGKETVEVEMEEAGEPEETEHETKPSTATPKKEDKKSKKKEKEKKEKKEKKQKDKKGKKNAPSNSFLHATGAALLAIPAEEAGKDEVEKVVSDTKILDMTEEELDMFQGGNKPEEGDSAASPKAPASGSDDGEIVVSYEGTPPVKSKLADSPYAEPMSSQEYMTVSEMERADEKKKKKMKHKSSKSILKQKQEEDSAKNVEGAGAILSSDSQMGFKSRFRTNPLLQMGGAAPPTPPPTPATGFSSSAPSEAGLASTEDEEDMPYDMYAQDMEAEDSQTPEDQAGESPEKEEKEEEEEEVTTETQENVVTSLDDEQDEEEEEEDEEEEEEDRKPVLKKWPPPKEVDYKPPEAKLEPSGVSVLKKWQPDTKSESKPTTPTSPGKPEGRGNVLKKWPPASTPEPKTSSPKLRPITKTSSPLTITHTPPVTLPPHNQEDGGQEKKLPVKLHPVKKEEIKSPKKQEEERDTELSKIKLKKATKAGAKYSSPSSEATSGAGNELSTLLKLRQTKM